jgi:hypothetical protein
MRKRRKLVSICLILRLFFVPYLYSPYPLPSPFFTFTDINAPYFADDNPMLPVLQRKASLDFGGDLGEKLRDEQRGTARSGSQDALDWQAKAAGEYVFSDDESETHTGSDADGDGALRAGEEDERTRAAGFFRRLSKDGMGSTPKISQADGQTALNGDDSDLDENGVSSRAITPPRHLKKTVMSPPLEFPSDAPESFEDYNPLVRQHSSDSNNPYQGSSGGQICLTPEKSPREEVKVKKGAQNKSKPISTTGRPLSAGRPISATRGGARPTSVTRPVNSNRPVSMSMSMKGSSPSTPVRSAFGRPASVRISPKGAPVAKDPLTTHTATVKEKMQLRDRLRAITNAPKAAPYKGKSPQKTTSPFKSPGKYLVSYFPPLSIIFYLLCFISSFLSISTPPPPPPAPYIYPLTLPSLSSPLLTFYLSTWSTCQAHT